MELLPLLPGSACTHSHHDGFLTVNSTQATKKKSPPFWASRWRAGQARAIGVAVLFLVKISLFFFKYRSIQFWVLTLLLTPKFQAAA